MSIQVKEAYTKLTDPVQKKNFVMHIENATLEYKKERRKLINKGVSYNSYTTQLHYSSLYYYIYYHYF